MTAFPSPQQPTTLARDWWNLLARNTPETCTEEPRTGVVRVAGKSDDDAPLLLAAAPDRLDIIRPFAFPGQPTALKALPTLDDALPPFVKLVGRWLEQRTAPAIGRLALGTDTIEPCSGIEDCRERLADYLPTIDMQATPPSDFEYRVNRRFTAAGDIAVNRIAKWSTQRVQDVVVGVVYGIQLETDINSVLGRTEALGEPAALLREFASFAQEFARRGDRL